MYKKFLIGLILTILFFTTFIDTNVYAEKDLTSELKQNIIPIETTKSESGFEDLMPLKEIFNNKKIIGMGEATHGTAEFFKMKHRMFEFLVEEMDYRVFAIEAEFGGSQIVNDYILNGKGSIDKSLEAMKFWTWDTKEVSEMIEWMKNYNDNTGYDDKIKFYGYDMQEIDSDIKYISNYLKKVDSPIKKEFEESKKIILI